MCESSHLSNFSALEVTLQPCCRMKSPTQVGLCFTSALLAAAASDLGCANDTEVPMGRSCHLARRADHRKDRAGQVRGSHQNLAREFRCSAASLRPVSRSDLCCRSIAASLQRDFIYVPCATASTVLSVLQEKVRQLEVRHCEVMYD